MDTTDPIPWSCSCHTDPLRLGFYSSMSMPRPSVSRPANHQQEPLTLQTVKLAIQTRTKTLYTRLNSIQNQKPRQTQIPKPQTLNVTQKPSFSASGGRRIARGSAKGESALPAIFVLSVKTRARVLFAWSVRRKVHKGLGFGGFLGFGIQGSGLRAFRPTFNFRVEVVGLWLSGVKGFGVQLQD